MDYRKIIIQGLNDTNSRKHLKNYFIRQFKQAEKNLYSAEEFYDGCYDILLMIENEFKKELSNKKWQLDYLNKKKVKDLEAIKLISDEIKIHSEGNRKIFLDRAEYVIPIGLMTYNELKEIIKALNEAKESLTPKQKINQSNMEQLDFDLNQSEVIYLFDILQEAGFLKFPKYHDGSYYRKLESCFTAKKIQIKDAEQKRNKMKEVQPLASAQNIKDKLIEAVNKITY